ncbi:MAG: DEAD/DEAH box helicase [Candidatus Nanoarchaeia archaeon]
MSTFSKLPLKKDILEMLDNLGFKKTREVQEKIIPLIINGQNIAFTSQTGSGKTLVYTVGFLSKLNPKQGLQMIVFVPTRELCSQVTAEMKRFCTPLNINIGMLYGARAIGKDATTLSKKNQIIVGTPGRVIHHINEKKLKVGEVKFMIYDESDQMFDNGFYNDCSYIKSRISKKAQIILASATTTDNVKKFIEEEIPDNTFLKIGIDIPKKLIQEKIYCPIADKIELLKKIILQKKIRKAIIFCNTKSKTDLIADKICHLAQVEVIHADMLQKEREKHLRQFIEGNLQIIIATDVAARGLHIENIDTIINFDVPTREEFYVHRIGRSGRDGKKGYALTIICDEDIQRFENIEIVYRLKDKVKTIQIK